MTNSPKQKKPTLSMTLIVVIAFVVIRFLWTIYIQSFDSTRDSNIPSIDILTHPSIETFTKKQHKTKKRQQRPPKTEIATKKRPSQEIYQDCFKANPSIIINGITQKTTLTHHQHLPYPLLHIGFPKTGTTSLHTLFKNSHIPSTHHSCRPYGKCGLCMRRASFNNAPPLSSCGLQDSTKMLFAQMEFTGNRNGTIDGEHCYWPQIQGLEAIHGDSPTATFLLLFREDIDKWVESVWKWNNLPYRMANCTVVFGTPKGGEVTKEEMKEFFCRHVRRVRRFVTEHPSHALVELSIDDPTTGERLAELFEGVNASHWRRENKGPKRVGLVKMGKKMNRERKRRRDALNL